MRWERRSRHAAGGLIIASVMISVGALSPTANPLGAATGPPAPTSVQAAAHDRAVLVSWVPPHHPPGGQLTQFVVTVRPAHAKAFERTFPAGEYWKVPRVQDTITGLTNGASYAFTVAAVNSAGRGPDSAATVPIIVGAPAIPAGSVSPRNGGAVATWKPKSANNSPITGYSISVYLSNARVQPPHNVEAAARTFTVTGLTNGKRYLVAVAARNARGLGQPLNLATIAGTPQAPTNVKARGNDPEGKCPCFEVTWAAPNNNGAPITQYVVNYMPADPRDSKPGYVVFPPDKTDVTFEPYNVGYCSWEVFTVTAINRYGVGAMSAKSSKAEVYDDCG